MTSMSPASTSQGFGFAPIEALPDISASDLKNKFSEVVRLASREPLAITRHNRREFVIITAERYAELQESHRAPLESLTTEFDALVSRINTAKGKRAANALFSSNTADLGRVAVKSRKSARHA
jgi:prevent-host-death family protein